VSADYKYSAFISYSHQDEKWASWLHKALETFKVPKYLVGETTAMGTVPERMGKVFRDREELSTSHSLGTELTQALEDSACQIVICSPNAANSHWTNEEILTYKRLGRENRIFCLIVDGEPGAEHAECFPPAVRFKMGADGVLSDEPAEPIAADARPQGDGKQNAKIKLIAGMFGVGFDALKQRELQRQKKRKAIITTASITGMFVAIGLAYSVYLNLTAIPPVEIEPISVLITDFDNRTGNPLFDGSLEQALNIAIEGASYTNTYPRANALSQAKELELGDVLDEETARLVSLRQDVKMVLAGSIEGDRNRFNLALRAMDPTSGEVITEVDARARDDTKVLSAVNSLAADLRKELGEDSLDLDQLEAGETVTASSLAAIKTYTTAQDLARAGQDEEAITYYRQAVEEDSNFVRAYSGWGLSAFKIGRRSEAEEKWQQALSLLDRMTERERFRTLGLYYAAVSLNYDKAIENYEQLVEKYPADGAGHNNLSVLYFLTLQFDKSMAESGQLIEIYPTRTLYRSNHALNAMWAGDLETAVAAAESVIAEDPTAFKPFIVLAMAALDSNDIDSAHEAYERMEATGPRGKSRANTGKADLRLFEGRAEQAEMILKAGIEIDLAENNERGVGAKTIALAQSYMAQERNAEALDALRSLTGDKQREGQLIPAAQMYIELGDIDAARAIAAHFAKQLRPQARAYASLINGLIALEQQEYIPATDELKTALGLADLWIVRFYLGQAYLGAGYPTEAISEFDAAHQRRSEAMAMFFDDVPTWRYTASLGAWRDKARQAMAEMASN
jgi:tetratricopeptide (TPR) repeat protein